MQTLFFILFLMQSIMATKQELMQQLQSDIQKAEFLLKQYPQLQTKYATQLASLQEAKRYLQQQALNEPVRTKIEGEGDIPKDDLKSKFLAWYNDIRAKLTVLSKNYKDIPTKMNTAASLEAALNWPTSNPRLTKIGKDIAQTFNGNPIVTVGNICSTFIQKLDEWNDNFDAFYKDKNDKKIYAEIRTEDFSFPEIQPLLDIILDVKAYEAEKKAKEEQAKAEAAKAAAADAEKFTKWQTLIIGVSAWNTTDSRLVDETDFCALWLIQPLGCDSLKRHLEEIILGQIRKNPEIGLLKTLVQRSINEGLPGLDRTVLYSEMANKPYPIWNDLVGSLDRSAYAVSLDSLREQVANWYDDQYKSVIGAMSGGQEDYSTQKKLLKTLLIRELGNLFGTKQIEFIWTELLKKNIESLAEEEFSLNDLSGVWGIESSLYQAFSGEYASWRKELTVKELAEVIQRISSQLPSQQQLKIAIKNSFAPSAKQPAPPPLEAGYDSITLDFEIKDLAAIKLQKAINQQLKTLSEIPSGINPVSQAQMDQIKALSDSLDVKLKGSITLAIECRRYENAVFAVPKGKDDVLIRKDSVNVKDLVDASVYSCQSYVEGTGVVTLIKASLSIQEGDKSFAKSISSASNIGLQSPYGGLGTDKASGSEAVESFLGRKRNIDIVLRFESSALNDKNPQMEIQLISFSGNIADNDNAVYEFKSSPSNGAKFAFKAKM